MQLQAEQLSKKGMQLTADKAAVESTLSLKEEEVRLHHSIALISHVHQGTGLSGLCIVSMVPGTSEHVLLV